MQYTSSSIILFSLLVLGGCSTGKQSGAQSSAAKAENSYSGKIEVVRNGKVVTSRDYVYGEQEVPVSRRILRDSFRLVEKDRDVAELKVYWPTYGKERELEKQITSDMEKGPAGKLEKNSGQEVRVNLSFSLTMTSTYKLIKSRGCYTLCERGSDNAEHYGYFAKSDKDATDIALEYLTRFVVPLSIGEYIYEARRDGIMVPVAMSNDQKK